MKRAVAALLLLIGLANAAPAQTKFTMPPPAGVAVVGVQVVASCAAASGLAAGNLAFLVMDTTGVLCISGSGGGGTTTPETPVPAGAATATNGWLGGCQYLSSLPTMTNTQQVGSICDVNGRLLTSSTATSSGAITNPTSTLTLTSSTAAYTAGQLIASSATAGSVVVPSFAIANSAGGAQITRLRLSTNDATTTAWGAQSIQVDLWSAAPTWTNGDRAAWSPATGASTHLGAFLCTMSAEYGDGAWAECGPTVGSLAMPKLASGTSIFWSLLAITGSGVTGASKVFTLTAELGN